MERSPEQGRRGLSGGGSPHRGDHRGLRRELLASIRTETAWLVDTLASLEAEHRQAEWEAELMGGAGKEERRLLEAALHREFANVEHCAVELERARAKLGALERLRARLGEEMDVARAPAPPVEMSASPSRRRHSPWSADGDPLRAAIAQAFAPHVRQQRLVEYLARQVALGRHLADALEDPYIVNRTTEGQRRELVTNSELMLALHEVMRQPIAG